MVRALFTFASLAAAVVFLAGCAGDSGPPKYIVKGKLSFKGEPMEVKPMVGRLRLWLVQQDVPPPVDPQGASVKPDGSFEIRGNDQKGIVAGKYKVCIAWQDDYPLGPDKLDKRFDQENSTIYRKVPEDGDIVIDVSRPEG